LPSGGGPQTGSLPTTFSGRRRTGTGAVASHRRGYYADSFDHAALRAAVRRARAVVLVDGIFLMRPELDDLWGFRVYVAVAEEESLGRGIKRDGAEAERFYRARYLPGQRLYDSQARPRERADVVVENDDVERPRLVWREGVQPPGA
jgi:uridine kinase